MAKTLLLQGPVGPFFRSLARELQARGDAVTQVAQNGGDWLFAEATARLAFRGRDHEWEPWLRREIRARGIDRVILFGDCRPRHRRAVALCRALDVPVWVCEEGYLRPMYLTLERDGVNGFSALPRDPQAYRHATVPPGVVEGAPFRWVMGKRVLTCIAYYLAAAWHRRRFPHYRHYRCMNLAREGLCWIRSAVRRIGYRRRDRRTAAWLRGRRFFLAPLQVHGDTQVRVHSPFASVTDMLRRTLADFARHAPPDAHLVCKHHPFDRGYTDYGALIAGLARRLGVADRVAYVHDLPLPDLLDAAAGVVVINSTVGISALGHGTPVCALGDAIYDLPGLTHQGPLAGFWRRPAPVDPGLFRAFRSYLLAYTQLNACSACGSARWDLLDRLGDFAPADADAGRQATPITLPGVTQADEAVALATRRWRRASG